MRRVRRRFRGRQRAEQPGVPDRGAVGRSNLQRPGGHSLRPAATAAAQASGQVSGQHNDQNHANCEPADREHLAQLSEPAAMMRRLQPEGGADNGQQQAGDEQRRADDGQAHDETHPSLSYRARPHRPTIACRARARNRSVPVYVVARKASPATGIAPGNGRLIPGRPLTAARPGPPQWPLRESQACLSAWVNVSMGCAPETPYFPPSTQNGTPLMPSRLASSSSARTSSP